MVLQVAKYFAFFQVAKTRTSFGICQIVYFSFISRNVPIKQILLTCFILFPISYLQTEESSQSI